MNLTATTDKIFIEFQQWN